LSCLKRRTDAFARMEGVSIPRKIETHSIVAVREGRRVGHRVYGNWRDSSGFECYPNKDGQP
jgi:hypothetical protein